MVKINIKRTFGEAIKGNESIKSYSGGFFFEGKDEWMIFDK